MNYFALFRRIICVYRKFFVPLRKIRRYMLALFITLVVVYVASSVALAIHAWHFFRSATFCILTFFGCLMFTPLMGALVLADTF